MAGRPIRDPHIVVVRALRGLGDALCAVPALRLIRESVPEATVRYVGIDEAERTMSRYPHYIDEFVSFPGWPGIPERSADFDEEAVHRCTGADVVIQMHGDGSVSNAFCAWLEPSALVAYGPVVTLAGMRVDTASFHPGTNEVLRCLDLASRAVRLLGRTPATADSALEFPLRSSDISATLSLRARLGIAERPYVVLHVGAASTDRRWPLERFAAVGRSLLNRRLLPVITGTSHERPLAERAAGLIGEGAIVAAGELSLGGTGALLAASHGVITNDTGISHLAAAVHAPSVVIFTGSDPKRWAPLDTERHVAVWSAAENASEVSGPPLPRPESPSVAAALSAAFALGITR